MGRDPLEWHAWWKKEVLPKFTVWDKQRRNTLNHPAFVRRDVLAQVIWRLEKNLTVDNRAAINLCKILQKMEEKRK